MIALPLKTKHGIVILVSIEIHCACHAMCNPKLAKQTGIIANDRFHLAFLAEAWPD